MRRPHPPRPLRRLRRPHRRVRPAAAPPADAACYVNQFEVGYNAFEFLLRFSQTHGEEPAAGPAPAQALVVTVPAYAKVFLDVLERSIGDYEAQYGEIALPQDPGLND